MRRLHLVGDGPVKRHCVACAVVGEPVCRREHSRPEFVGLALLRSHHSVLICRALSINSIWDSSPQVRVVDDSRERIVLD